MNQDEALLRLQKIDSEIDGLSREAETLPERARILDVEAALSGAEAALKQTSEKMAVLRHDAKRLEDESTRLDEKSRAEEKKLYAGKIGNPKELISLQEEIKAMGVEKDKVDTEYLKISEDAEETEKAEEGLKREREDLDKQLKVLRTDLERKGAEIAGKIASLQTQRTIPLEKLDETVVKIYGQMREKGHGLAVVEATDGVCGGCNLENPEEGHTGAGGLRRCEYCHRIIITR